MLRQPHTLWGWKRETAFLIPKEAEELGAIIPSRGHGPLLGHSGGSQEAGTYENSFLPTSHPSLSHANRVLLPSLKSLQGQGQSPSNSRVCFQPQHPSLTQGIVGAFCHMHPGYSPCILLLVPEGHSTGKMLDMWHSLCPNHRSWTRGTKASEAEQATGDPESTFLLASSPHPPGTWRGCARSERTAQALS